MWDTNGHWERNRDTTCVGAEPATGRKIGVSAGGGRQAGSPRMAETKPLRAYSRRNYSPHVGSSIGNALRAERAAPQ